MSVACFLRLVFLVGRPGVSLKGALLSLLLPLCMWLQPVAAEPFRLAKAGLVAQLIGTYPQFCMFFVPLFSTVPLVALMIALKQSAPENRQLPVPASRSGRRHRCRHLAWHCPDDSPLYSATWYLLRLRLSLLSEVQSAAGCCGGKKRTEGSSDAPCCVSVKCGTRRPAVCLVMQGEAVHHVGAGLY